MQTLFYSYVSSALVQVPARAAAAAAVARALAGLPPHQRFSLPSSSEELRSIYGSIPQGQLVEELEEEFYEEVCSFFKYLSFIFVFASFYYYFFL